MSSLAHHGVKGQKWGVRRYQNPDGTRTALGKKQLKAIRLSRNEEGIRQVYRSLSDKDLNLLGYEKDEIEANRKDDFKDLGRRHTDYDQYNRVRYKNGDAIGYIAATGYQTTVGRGKKIVNILAVDLAVNSNYRGQGHSVELGKDIVRWFDRYGSKEYDRMEWYAKAENIASQKAAERSGFERRSKKEAAQGWVKYAYQRKSPFESATNDVKSKTSTNVRPVKKEPIDIDSVMDRGKLSVQDAHRCAKLADKVYSKAAEKEPAITNDITGIAKKNGFGMYGLEHRLKQPTSIAGKIGSDSKDDGVSFDESARGIKDAVRYTTVSDNSNFVKNYNKVKSELESKGYEEVRCKNFFEKYRAGEVQHKAVQATYRTPDGYEFEVQFQTPESQAAKELKIPIYEERRKQGISAERAKQLENEMHELAEKVPYPRGIGTIQSHNGIKHTSIGGNMNYIYGSTLVLGDTSYLEHHGILGQKWGVRRFQNPDGSLTAAGRQRLGYSLKKAAGTVKGVASAAVKKSFEAGKKAAASAKEKHEAEKEKKLAEKKEKASRTRAGVIANKNMFTAAELRELNSKFDEQDKMKTAFVKQGLVYVNAINQTAKAIGEVGKAYNSITGQSIGNMLKEKKSAAETKAKEEKEEKEKKATEDSIAKAQAQKQEIIDKVRANKRSKAEKEAAEEKERTALKEEAREREIYDRAQKTREILDAFKESRKEMARTKTSADEISKKYTKSPEDSTESVPKTSAPKVNQNESLDDRVRNVSSTLSAVSDAMKAKTAASKKDIKANNLKRYIDSKPDSSNEQLAKSADALMKQVSEVQSKIQTSNNKGSTVSQKEEIRKLKELETISNGYMKAVNDPTNDPDRLTKQYIERSKRIIAKLKHSDISSDELSHYGVLGMKWGKHIMKGMGSVSVNDSVGGGGGADDEDDEEEDKTLADILGIDQDKYREKTGSLFGQGKSKLDYSTEKNKMPGKHHKDESDKYQQAADSDKKKMIAARKAMRKATSEADRLEKKIKSVNLFNDRQGYLVGKERVRDKKRVKTLRAQAKAAEAEMNESKKSLTENSKKALNAYNKWQQSPSGKYDNKMRKGKRVRHSDFFVEDGTLYLEHHGIKGQKWGVRRFQNPDGTLTDKGRKHYQKKLSLEKRKLVAANAARGEAERYRTPATLGIGVVSAIMTATALSSAPLATIAMGAAYVGAVSAGIAYGTYTLDAVASGWGAKRSRKRIGEYKNMLKQDGFRIEDGTLYLEHHGLERRGDFFVKDGTLYLEHHGIKGQKHGVRRFQNMDGSLTAAGKARYGQGKVDSTGGGGGGGESEEDEDLKAKLEEAAKKAGMTVDEYRKKMGDKIYDALGGKHKARAKDLMSWSNESIRNMNEEKRKAARGEVSQDFYKKSREYADMYRQGAKEANEDYRKSIAGRYDRLKKSIKDRKKSSIKIEHHITTSSNVSAKEAHRVSPQKTGMVARKKRVDSSKVGTIRKVGKGRGKKASR